ncbi:MAG: putative lipid II flippase FtsW [Candidatus Methylomirabilales bacterium]
MRGDYDKVLLTVTLILVGLGIIMVYSASAIRAQDRFGDPSFFLKRQVLWAVVGLTTLIWVSGQDYRHLQRWAPSVYFASVLFLVLVLIPGVGTKVNGAQRWFRFSSLSFQPAELAKLGLILCLSRLLAKKGERVGEFMDGFLPPFILAVVVVGLIALQPNYGTALMIFFTVGVLLFAAGTRVSHLVLVGLSLVPVLGLLLMQAPHVRGRVLAMFDPTQVPPRYLYQITQSQVALGRGGSLGTGLGDGMQKLFYLPEPHTDFIFAIVGEELGFAGGMGVLGLFGLFLWRGIRIALRASDPFGCYVAMGITFLIVVQAAVNLGMVVGLLPTTGLPLPFLSFGGSSLVISLFGVGILLSISRCPPVYRGCMGVRGGRR